MNITQENVGKTRKSEQEKTFNESEPEANHGAAAVLMDQTSV